MEKPGAEDTSGARGTLPNLLIVHLKEGFQLVTKKKKSNKPKKRPGRGEHRDSLTKKVG